MKSTRVFLFLAKILEAELHFQALKHLTIKIMINEGIALKEVKLADYVEVQGLHHPLLQTYERWNVLILNLVALIKDIDLLLK